MTPTYAYSRDAPTFGTAGESLFLAERRLRLLDDDGVIVLSPWLSKLLSLHSIFPSVAVICLRVRVVASFVRLCSMSCSASKAVATAALTDGGDRTGVVTSATSLLCSSSEQLLSSDRSDMVLC